MFGETYDFNSLKMRMKNEKKSTKAQKAPEKYTALNSEACRKEWSEKMKKSRKRCV